MTDLRSKHQKRISTGMKAWWRRRRTAELERLLRLAELGYHDMMKECGRLQKENEALRQQLRARTMETAP